MSGDLQDTWLLDGTSEGEEIRQALRRALRSADPAALAEAIGIHRSTLQAFLLMSYPTPEVWERLRDWYADRPEERVESMRICLAALAQEFPAHQRAWARRELADVLMDLYRRAEAQPPGWLLDETEPA